MFRYFIISSFVIFTMHCNAQSDKILSGPMTSYIDAYGTQIWFLLDGEVKKISIDIRDYENDNLVEYDFEVINTYNTSKIPYTVLLDNLQPNMEYLASVFIDDIFVQEIDIFTRRPHLDDIQFLLGSNSGDKSNQIFHYMKQTNSDFMVWLGGHVKINDANSFENMLDDYVNTRLNSTLSDFLSSTPQIATWGDLDFPLSSNMSWDLKEKMHSVFKLFWPNSVKKTYNYTYFDYGAYQRYSYNDVDIFLLDAQTFREDDKTSLYGDKQIERLFQEIKDNGATFTVIASPKPFSFESKESFINYKKQFDYFMYRLQIAEINGLVLVSAGGELGTQMNQYKLSNNDLNSYVHEFNFSSIESNNYSLINISGKSGDRILSFETYNENGNLMYRKNLHQKDLCIN